MSAGPSDRQAELLATDRWAWLGPFVERWYADPLTAGDGSPPEGLAVAETRLGAPLPAALAEWFELVGRRLEPVQDSPATPLSLTEIDGRPVVWAENQWVWAIVADPASEDGDDPRCTLADNDDWTAPDAALSRTVHGMILSDTLVGVWAGQRRGPLGRLGDQVRGGCIEDVTEAERAVLYAAYEPLPVPPNPFWDKPPHGDADTAIRGDEDSGSGVEWMTATDAAYRHFSALVPLDPAGGSHEVLLRIDQPSDAAFRMVFTRRGQVDSAPFTAAIAGGLAHLGMIGGGRSGLEIRATTTRPEQTAAALLAVVPAAVRDEVVVTTHPAREATPRVLHP
ncbi:MAG: hypothetical protein V9G08_02490 [Dermatophilaceae bacterium]